MTQNTKETERCFKIRLMAELTKVLKSKRYKNDIGQSKYIYDWGASQDSGFAEALNIVDKFESK